jgi:DNA-directed RNA polymerase specialized sigma24 family protein
VSAQQIKLIDELREIRFRKTEIIGTEERIKRLESIAEKTTTTAQEGSRGTGVQDRMAQTVITALDLMDALRLRIVEHEAMVQAIESEVDKLAPNFRSVIRLRDFEGLRWDVIAARMGYEVRHCKRIHQYAFEAIRSTTIKCPCLPPLLSRNL